MLGAAKSLVYYYIHKEFIFIFNEGKPFLTFTKHWFSSVLAGPNIYVYIYICIGILRK